MWICYAQVNRRDTKKMFQTKPRGKRSSGISRIRWLDQIREDIEDRGQTWTDTYIQLKHGRTDMAGDLSVIDNPSDGKDLRKKKETLKIYHVLEDLNYGIQGI